MQEQIGYVYLRIFKYYAYTFIIYALVIMKYCAQNFLKRIHQHMNTN